MTVPFEKTSRTLFDRVIDICMGSPAIVAKARNLPHVPSQELLCWIIELIQDIATMINKFDTFYAEFLELNRDSLLFWEQTESDGSFVLSDDGEPSVLQFTPTLWFPDLDTASILFMYCM